MYQVRCGICAGALAQSVALPTPHAAGDMLVAYLMDEESKKFGMEEITTEASAIAVVNGLLAHTEPR